jgi:Protein of unknown function (DUF4232)
MLTTPPATLAARGMDSGRPRRRKAVALAMTAAAAAGLLAGCASASPHQAGTAPAGGAGAPGGKTATPGGRTATPGGPDAGTGRAASGTAGLALCQPSSLRVTVNASQAGGAAGSTYYPVDFTNTSSSPCGLYGYPGMSFVTTGDGSGRQIGAAAQQDPSFGKVPVRLAAGGAAHAWLRVAEAGNYPAATCQPVRAHWLRVYAPGETQARYVSRAFDACASASAPLLTVMPVRSGQGVQGTTP